MADNRIAFLEQDLVITCTRLYQNVLLSGLTISLTVTRESDNKYWNGSIWDAGETVLTMTENSAIPGEYEYRNIALTDEDELVCHCYITDGVSKFDSVERITIIKKPLALFSSVDTTTVEYILECVVAMVNGKLTSDGTDVTLFKRNDTTPLTVIRKIDNGRIRVS